MSQLQWCQGVILLPLFAEEETDGERIMNLPWGAVPLDSTRDQSPSPPTAHSFPHLCRVVPASLRRLMQGSYRLPFVVPSDDFLHVV